MNRFVSSVVNFFKGNVSEAEVAEQKKILEISDTQLKMEAEVETSVDRAIIAFTIDLVKQKDQLKKITAIRDSIVSDLEMSERVVSEKADDDPTKAPQMERINKAKKLVFEELPATIDKLDDKIAEYEGKIYNLKTKKLTLQTLRESTSNNKKVIEQSYKTSNDALEKQKNAAGVQLEDQGSLGFAASQQPVSTEGAEEEALVEGGMLTGLNNKDANGDSGTKVELENSDSSPQTLHFVSPDEENGYDAPDDLQNMEETEIFIQPKADYKPKASEEELDMLTKRAANIEIQPFEPQVFHDIDFNK